MLKCRIIPIELLLRGRLVKTRLFNSPRDVGDPVKSSKVYSDQDADELLLLQIDREARNIKPLIDAVSRIAEHCFVPLTAGGGVSSLDDAAQLFEVGVDKVLVNSVAYSSLDVLSAISSHYGRQALVVGIDVRTDNKEFVLYSDCGRKQERVLLGDHIASVIAAGAGELLLQAIDFDGMMQGYNLELLRRVVSACSVPVIIAAGAGQFSHLKDAFDSGAAAAACGSLFNFGDNNPLRAKAFLKNYGVPLKRVK